MSFFYFLAHPSQALFSIEGLSYSELSKLSILEDPVVVVDNNTLHCIINQFVDKTGCRSLPTDKLLPSGTPCGNNSLNIFETPKNYP